MHKNTPNFVCIGAQKAGTGWLYKNLNLHPDVWLPPIKEIHFFDRDNNTSHLKRILNKDSKAYLSINQLKSIVKATLNFKCDIPWLLNYFFYPHNPNWYLKIFNPAKGRVTGELTPAYAILEKVNILPLQKLNPDIKIIYIIRNPVDRLMSQARMYFARNKTAKISFDKFFNKSNPLAHINYVKNLKTWQSVFPESNILILFFDELENDPIRFYFKVLNFLNLDTNGIQIPKQIKKKRNSYSFAIPERYEIQLYQEHDKLFDELDDFFKNEYSKKWKLRKDAIVTQFKKD
ncbi:MAG: sulfotransferase domain-containing protein [Cyclobacteriaceae bacterium]